jgi:hypothetical protein
MTNPVTDWTPYYSLGSSPTARSVLRVGAALVAEADPALSRSVARNAARLDARLKQLSAALDRRGIPSEPGVDSRAVDLRADHAWAAVELRLRAWLVASDALGESHAKVLRARELTAALFADGTDFLKLPYAEQEVEMDRLLRLIDSESLSRDLTSLVGREFVDALALLQPEYASMVAAMLTRDDQKERVVTLLRDAIRAIEQYASSVVGAVDDEDPASVSHVRKLLAPIANYRALAAQRDEKSPPDEPAPPTP